MKLKKLFEKIFVYRRKSINFATLNSAGIDYRLNTNTIKWEKMRSYIRCATSFYIDRSEEIIAQRIFTTPQCDCHVCIFKLYICKPNIGYKYQDNKPLRRALWQHT